MSKKVFLPLFALLLFAGFNLNAQTQAEIDATKVQKIYFDHDSNELFKGSKAIIESLVAKAKNNPHVEIRVSGMTNTIGNVDYNYKLAERRASSVKDYIESLGGKVSDQKAFGPLASSGDCCVCDVNENRRVEIEIIDQKILSGIGY